MAPDDLKFVRMEARLQEQQLVMAELTGRPDLGAKKADSTTVYDMDALRRHCQQQQYQGPAMVDNTSDGGGGTGCTGPIGLQPDPLEGAPRRPFAAADSNRPRQTYGACEPRFKQEATKTTSANNEDDQDKRDERPPAGATIGGGNKFLHRDGGWLRTSADHKSGVVLVGASKSAPDEPADDDTGKEPRPCLIQRLAGVIPCFGILLALCASFCLGTAGMLVKLVESVHGIEVAVLRFVVETRTAAQATRASSSRTS
jgi:hypothetical protein